VREVGRRECSDSLAGVHQGVAKVVERRFSQCGARICGPAHALGNSRPGVPARARGTLGARMRSVPYPGARTGAKWELAMASSVVRRVQWASARVAAG